MDMELLASLFNHLLAHWAMSLFYWSITTNYEGLEGLDGSLDSSKFTARPHDMNPIEHACDCLQRRIAASNVQCGAR